VSPKVFFIDDEQLFLTCLQRYFLRAEAGWEMGYFSDPAEALRRIEQERNVVLVVDWEMPGMDGLTLCRRARHAANRAGSSLHIIMLTGNSGPDYTVNALECGADDYLTKPVDMHDLRTHIEIGLAAVR